MKIIWRDTDLKTHEIDLSNAVDVKIDGVALSINNGKGVRISTDNRIKILPIAANAIEVSEED
jgi:hypothetical protein